MLKENGPFFYLNDTLQFSVSAVQKLPFHAHHQMFTLSCVKCKNRSQF